MSLFQDLKLKRRKVDTRCSSDADSVLETNASSPDSSGSVDTGSKPLSVISNDDSPKSLPASSPSPSNGGCIKTDLPPLSPPILLSEKSSQAVVVLVEKSIDACVRGILLDKNGRNGGSVLGDHSMFQSGKHKSEDNLDHMSPILHKEVSRGSVFDGGGVNKESQNRWSPIPSPNSSTSSSYKSNGVRNEYMNGHRADEKSVMTGSRAVGGGGGGGTKFVPRFTTPVLQMGESGGVCTMIWANQSPPNADDAPTIYNLHPPPGSSSATSSSSTSKDLLIDTDTAVRASIDGLLSLSQTLPLQANNNRINGYPPHPHQPPAQIAPHQQRSTSSSHSPPHYQQHNSSTEGSANNGRINNHHQPTNGNGNGNPIANNNGSCTPYCGSYGSPPSQQYQSRGSPPDSNSNRSNNHSSPLNMEKLWLNSSQQQQRMSPPVSQALNLTMPSWARQTGEAFSPTSTSSSILSAPSSTISGNGTNAVREDRMPGGRNSGAVYNLYKVKYKKHKKNQKNGQVKAMDKMNDKMGSLPDGIPGTPTVVNLSGNGNENNHHINHHHNNHHHHHQDVGSGQILKTALTNPAEVVHLRQRLENSVSSSRGERRMTFEQSRAILNQLVECDHFEDVATLRNLEQLFDEKCDITSKLCQIGDSIVFKLVQWTKRLPFYGELPVSVHTQLLTHKWHELLVLTTSAYQAIYGRDGSVDDSDVAKETSANLVKLQTCLANMLGRTVTIDELKHEVGIIVEKISHLVCKLRRLNLSMEEYTCLKIITMLNQEEIQPHKELEVIQDRYVCALKTYSETCYPHQPARFRDILVWLPEMQLAADLLMQSKLFYVPFLLNSAIQR
ncbi:Ligand-binding domain of nuclear hormone receptor [Chamberlinius hualienensis]